VTISDNLAFVAADSAGFQMVDVSSCLQGAPADLNDDGVVDGADLELLLGACGLSPEN